MQEFAEQAEGELEQLVVSRLGGYRTRSSSEVRTIKRVSPVLWLNLLCLDAPMVAIGWQWLFARSFHIPIDLPSRLALFLTAWLIYLSDRLIDSWQLNLNIDKTLRQRFCLQHRGTWMWLLGLVTILDGWIVLRCLDMATVLVGLMIGLACGCYLVANCLLGKVWRFVPIKEACIGVLFAIGTVAALLMRIEVWSAASIALFGCFALLCSFNCVTIGVWELDLDQAQAKYSLATQWPACGRYLPALAFLLAILAVAVPLATNGPLLPGILIAISALQLGGLDLMADRIPCDERTAWADLVLLIPLLPFVLQFVL